MSSDRRRVLVADNNTDLTQVMAELLRTEGSIEFVGHVATGAEALAQVASGAVDVLVLDLGLDDVPGLEVLQRIVRAGWPTRVIVHTGHSSPELAQHVRSKGAAAYVVKDGDIKALLAAIHAA